MRVLLGHPDSALYFVGGHCSFEIQANGASAHTQGFVPDAREISSESSRARRARHAADNWYVFVVSCASSVELDRLHAWHPVLVIVHRSKLYARE
jgi:hypothetical protein